MNEYKYYDVIITNKGETLSKEANIHTRLAAPLLDNPGEYKMMIQKFAIDGEGIPISIIELKNPQTIKTQNWETIHNVYVVNSTGQVATANVLFNSFIFPNTPPMPVKKEGTMGYYNNRDKYFFVYTYTHLIRSINDALSKAYNQLFPSIPYPPFFQYDPISQLITFKVPNAVFAVSPPAINANIYFSMPLRKYVGEGFAGSFISPGQIPGINENVYSIILTTNGINDPQTDATYLAIPQEYVSITSFSTTNAILIQSRTIPVRKEHFPSNYHQFSLTNNSSNQEEQYTNMNAFPILSVFYPHSSSAGDFRGKIIYSNDSLMSGDLIDLQGNAPLSEIQIGVYFTDNFNNVYPLPLLPGKTVNIRLAFVK